VIVLYVLKYIPHLSVTPLFVIPARNIRRSSSCSLMQRVDVHFLGVISRSKPSRSVTNNSLMI